MVPATKEIAVKNALQLTFGVSEWEDIKELTAGLSPALVFRIVVLGKAYLLRIITRTDMAGDPTHEYACMKAAAEAGIAPRIWYMSIADRIAITDFVAATTFQIKEARIQLPAVLKRLHSLPPFSHRVHYLDMADRYMRKFQEAGLLPESMITELVRLHTHIIGVYPRNQEDMVACHNDLKPENILFDGTKAWIVDWEAAFLNDRYVDLAIIANFVVTNEAEEMVYLKSYFGESVTIYHRARFFLMRQLLHLFYITVFLSLVAAAGVPIDWTLSRPDFRSFHARMWAGEISLANHDARQQYAWVHMDQLLYNVQLPRWEEALDIVAGGSGYVA
ncbi:phosphotransferase [Chitinophaga nivalis]|uniref:Phosphotransferase n=1 Tax=Chitinophaga nivalis TaxID=2991709 RepID=A0ABT3ITK6_9BACT|nr:phosphotransferase [Chitinophaga nivalis]MCW3462989.1 phosphotransferase [Chitinophaga nivalis]MCW3487321.1 phosphotransferase [Chitinophaga nivalis]